MRFAASSALFGLAVLVGAASGCQEIVGIQPWDSAKGGAPGTTSSETTAISGTTDVSATTTVSGSGSSSSSGTPCLMNCLGGPCVDNVCQPFRKDIPDITAGFIRALPNELVVATASGATAGTWTLARVDKLTSTHDVTTITTAPSLHAISTVDQDSLYFASADGIFLWHLSEATNTPLTDPSMKNVTTAAGLERVAFGSLQELCWVHASDSPTSGGIYCQPPTTLVAATQRAQFSYGGRLVADGTLVYSIRNVGTNGAVVVSVQPGSQMDMKAYPFAADLAVDDTYVYVLAPAQNELVAIEKADPTGFQNKQTLSGTPSRLVRFGPWLYVLFTSDGVIRRYETKTLSADPTFAVYTGGYPVDIAVDGDGVYWIGIGGDSVIGMLVQHNEP